MIVLSYLWILALIPFVAEKDDHEVQWHAKHGLVLFGAEVLFWIAVNIVIYAAGGMGCFIFPLYFLAFVVIVVIRVICIVQGINGQRFLIPGISQYVERF